MTANLSMEDPYKSLVIENLLNSKQAKWNVTRRPQAINGLAIDIILLFLEKNTKITLFAVNMVNNYSFPKQFRDWSFASRKVSNQSQSALDRSWDKHELVLKHFTLKPELFIKFLLKPLFRFISRLNRSNWERNVYITFFNLCLVSN